MPAKTLKNVPPSLFPFLMAVLSFQMLGPKSLGSSLILFFLSLSKLLLLTIYKSLANGIGSRSVIYNVCVCVYICMKQPFLIISNLAVSTYYHLSPRFLQQLSYCSSCFCLYAPVLICVARVTLRKCKSGQVTLMLCHLICKSQLAIETEMN